MSRFVVCALGHSHYGAYGGAGLLLIRDDGRVLLQQRSAHVQKPYTWAVPGGARDPGETAVEAALREAHEEIGADPGAIRVVDEYAADCGGGWVYTTVIGRVPDLTPVPNWEVAQMRWVRPEDVTGYGLHPAFRTAWDGDLVDLIRSLG